MSRLLNRIATLSKSSSSVHNFKRCNTSIPINQIPNEPIPELNTLPTDNNPKAQTEHTCFATRCTVLDNGLKVISTKTPGNLSVIGAHINFGDRDTTKETMGTPMLFERTLISETKNRDRQEMSEDLYRIGENIQIHSQRDSLFVTGATSLELIPNWLDILSDSISNPVFKNEVITEELRALEFAAKDAQLQPEYIIELLHSAAFGDTAFGRSRFPDSKNEYTSTMLGNIHSQYFTASNMAIGAAGTDHDYLVDACKHFFKDLPTHQAPTPEKPKFIGGHKHLTSDDLKHTSVGIIFSEGCQNFSVKKMVTIATMQFLLGGGSSFSAGGPGKGMYSRLYADVLRQYPWIESCNAIGSIYQDITMLSLIGQCDPKNAQHLFQILFQEFEKLTTKTVDAVELERAKNRLRCSLLFNLEQRPLLVEEMTRQRQFGTEISVESLCTWINSVTANDIREMAKLLLTSPTTTAIHGNFQYP